jgi:hypothetical protein
MIRFENVAKSYGDTEVIKGINLEINDNDILKMDVIEIFASK